MQFVMSSQAVNEAGVKILTYAPAGVGKTVLTATAPRPILISAESGLLSLKRENLERIFGKNNPTITYDVPTIVIESLKDLHAAYQYVTQSAEAKNFDTICMDSITEIAEQVLATQLKMVKDPRQAYGELASQMLAIVKAYRDIKGKHVYMSSKMAQDKDEISGMMMFMPMMPGKQVGAQLPYLFDEVFRLGVAKDQQSGKSYRFFQTQPDMQYVAKDRSGALAPIDVPDITAVINKILQGA